LEQATVCSKPEQLAGRYRVVKPDEMLARLQRLECKTLDGQFLSIVRDGMGCSKFEASAILDVVKEVYFPLRDEADPLARPGKLTLMVVDADEPAGKPIAECSKRCVALTIHRGPQDDALIVKQGAAALRRARIPNLAQEALSQGGLLTIEDLAYRVFFVTPRTIGNDLRVLRQSDPDQPIPLRGTIQDIGPLLSHRVRIVELALDGRTMSEIQVLTHHSPRAIANYVSTFSRCTLLHAEGLQVGQIAFLLRRSKKLIGQYLELLDSCLGDKNRRYHLEETIRLGVEEKKRDPRSCSR